MGNQHMSRSDAMPLIFVIETLLSKLTHYFMKIRGQYVASAPASGTHKSWLMIYLSLEFYFFNSFLDSTRILKKFSKSCFLLSIHTYSYLLQHNHANSYRYKVHIYPPCFPSIRKVWKMKNERYDKKRLRKYNNLYNT